jgi:hypothetical protein
LGGKISTYCMKNIFFVKQHILSMSSASLRWWKMMVLKKVSLIFANLTLW